MATSKREEERNEKIIRGLMKLPPNRRCINCNNLGPQYVCSNFWTFVCMICSGIHREFTHRVKSVSMSKFTSQEVEALQNGGNQRAREAYLKDWDLQRQRLPNSSDADKVREFIKAVYVERKYAVGNKSDKPLRDSQTESDAGEEIRRASSYHSYSQSPPYDFQYEDRLNRKQGSSLSRKPGSDRGLYGRKAASFVYSPGRFSEHLSDDRFANEGSSSRVSDYSVSSGGDPFRSAPQSPNLQRDDGFSSPTLSLPEKVVDGLQHQTRNSDVSAKRDADKVPVPRPKRTVSFESFGVIDKDSRSLGSVRHASDSTEKHQSVTSTQTQISGFTPLSQLPEAHFSAPAVDLFQAPADSVASTDLFQSPGDSTVHLQTSTSSSSSYFSGGNPSHTNLNPKLPEPVEEVNEGWATFDLPQFSKPATAAVTAGIPETHSKNSLKDLDSVASSNIEIPWLAFQNSAINGPGPSISDPWMGGHQDTQVTTNMTSSQPWNAFGEAHEQEQQHVVVQGTYMQGSVENSSSASILFAKDSAMDGLQKHAPAEGFSFPNSSSHYANELSFNQPIHPFMDDVAYIQPKSSNPFDSEFEASNTFLDTSSLQADLPMTTPSPYAVDVHNSWFSPHPMGSYDGMYVAAQPPSSQLSNMPPHGSAASVGGNPFA